MRGKVYCYKFMWNGELIRESTKQGNDKKARNIESAHRTALANGLVGIREKKPVPSLADFLKNDFEPFVKRNMRSSRARRNITPMERTWFASEIGHRCLWTRSA